MAIDFKKQEAADEETRVIHALLRTLHRNIFKGNGRN